MDNHRMNARSEEELKNIMIRRLNEDQLDTVSGGVTVDRNEDRDSLPQDASTQSFFSEEK